MNAVRRSAPPPHTPGRLVEIVARGRAGGTLAERCRLACGCTVLHAGTCIFPRRHRCGAGLGPPERERRNG